MSKTRKPKRIEGWLCRDKDGDIWSDGTDGILTLLDPDVSTPTYEPEHGWDGSELASWTLDEWKETYDLAPPRPGQKFYVSLEL